MERVLTGGCLRWEQEWGRYSRSAVLLDSPPMGVRRPSARLESEQYSLSVHELAYIHNTQQHSKNFIIKGKKQHKLSVRWIKGMSQWGRKNCMRKPVLRDSFSGTSDGADSIWKTGTIRGHLDLGTRFSLEPRYLFTSSTNNWNYVRRRVSQLSRLRRHQLKWTYWVQPSCLGRQLLLCCMCQDSS